MSAFENARKFSATCEAPGAACDLHACSFDDDSRTAVFFATYHAKHTGEGGPVAPTNREVASHYVYGLAMSEKDKVEKMARIWNAPWAMREPGWIE